MVVIGLISGKVYKAGPLVASAGEGSVYRVEGDKSLLLKILTRQLTVRQVEKLKILAAFKSKPAHSAIPTEVVIDPATRTPVGFVQPYFSKAVPLTRVLDSHGRTGQKLPDDLAFRVKLCRLLAEAFVRIHSASLVGGDVSDGNFLLGRDWLGRASVVYAIDCNSFQVTIRTNQGNECFPSGVATEEYAAPEVQSTDWATSLRTVYSDSFGLAILAWKILFNGSHPFAVVTPRSVDVPPLGERIEKRLFPWSPGSPIPANWKAPAIQPSLAVLPLEIREQFFRTFSSDDLRDRPTAEEWCETLRSWEWALTPSLPLRFLAAWNSSLSDRLSQFLSTFKPYAGRVLVLAGLLAMTVFIPQLEPAKSKSPRTSPKASDRDGYFLLNDNPKLKSTRPRFVDPELFPASLWDASTTSKE